MKRPFSLTMMIILIVLSACNTPAVVEPTFTQPPPTTATPVPTATAVPTATPAPDFIWRLEDLQQAVIRISVPVPIRTGLDELNRIGSGSGVIIDPAGLALTANHVIAGNTEVDVWLTQADGTTQKTTARVIGVSECHDLALLQIKGEGSFPYLTWSDTPLLEGEKVVAAGYAQGKKYEAINGVISATDGNGISTWSAVENVLLHTAKVDLTSLGGPLVDGSGRLAGINISFNPQSDLYMALDRDTLKFLLPSLVAGEGDTIGLHAVPLDSIPDRWEKSGLLVTAVRKDSIAEKAGIQAGDILVLMGSGVPAERLRYDQLITAVETDGIARQGSLKGYCDLLSSKMRFNNKVDYILLRSLQVGKAYKINAATTCKGQINGDPAKCDENPTIFFGFDSPKEITDWIYLIKPKTWVERPKPEVKNSKLVFDNPPRDASAYLIYTGWSSADVRIVTSTTNKGTIINAVGTICRYSEEDGKQTWYEFFVVAQYYFIFMYNGSSWELLQSGANANIKFGNETNVFETICQGSQLSLYANGQRITSFANSKLTKGSAGLAVSAFYSKELTEFNDFTISEP